MRNNIGVAYPAVDEACFTDIVLPINLSLIKELNKDAEMLTNLQVTLSQKRQAFSENLNSSIDRWISEV